MRREDQEEAYAIARQVFREEIGAVIQSLKEELTTGAAKTKVEPAPADLKKGGK